MSDLVFPTLPACVTVSRTPVHETTIQQARSGKELRIRHLTEPRYRYTLNVSLRQHDAYAEVAAFVGFVLAVAGRYDSFLFDDPYDGVRRRCRFDADDFELSRLSSSVWSLDGLEIITVV